MLNPSYVNVEKCASALAARLLLLEPVSSVEIAKDFGPLIVREGGAMYETYYRVQVTMRLTSHVHHLMIDKREMQYVENVDEWVEFKFHKFVDAIWPKREE